MTTLVLHGGQRTKLSVITKTLENAGLPLSVKVSDEGATVFARRVHLQDVSGDISNVRDRASAMFGEMGIDALFE